MMRGSEIRTWLPKAILAEATTPINSKGGIFDTIQEAIDDMDVAGWVYVPPGTYTEAVDIIGKNNLMLYGAGWGMTKITYAGNDHTLDIDNSDDVIVRDIRIDQTSTGNNVNAIRLDDAQRCKIRNVYIGDSDQDGIYFDGVDSKDCEISENYITGADNVGIADTIYPGCTNIKISNNIIKSCGQEGIYIYSAGCLIENNICESNGYVGLWVDGDYGVISGNLCIKNEREGLVVDGNHNNAVNNICINNSWGNSNVWDGIYVAGNYNTIIGNNCYDDHSGCAAAGCQANGIYVVRSTYTTITGNVCRDNLMDGIKVHGTVGNLADYNTLNGNICEGNAGRGIYIFGDKANLHDYANKNIVVGNQLFNNTGTNIDDDGTLTEKGHNITV